jgi:hypothetical protein
MSDSVSLRRIISHKEAARIKIRTGGSEKSWESKEKFIAGAGG